MPYPLFREDFRPKLYQMLIVDEGQRDFPYDDATGRHVRSQGYVTIGIGRNLNAQPLRPVEIAFMFEQDIEAVVNACTRLFGLQQFESLSTHRQLGLINLVFNLGEAKLRTEFTETYPALKAKHWTRAANLLRATKWYQDVKKDRAERVLALIEKDAYVYPDAPRGTASVTRVGVGG